MQHTTTLEQLRRPRKGQLDLPFDPPAHEMVRVRRRIRQAPWLLLPILAIVTGIGVSYVGEHATATQNSYVLGNLIQENSALTNQNTSLASQLQQLKATARILTAAEKLGMRPAQGWGYSIVTADATNQANSLLQTDAGKRG